MPTLNLGIVAHVDAGKTSLTERLLFDAGAVAELGSVDAGTTRTDSMDLERRRGITIRAAVTGVRLAGLDVNLLDTPGHPDFIAEVERSLTVLDAAVLVVSGVEGVQPQTVVLWRALARLQIPTVVFVNKLDRPGASPDRVAGQLRRRLAVPLVVLAAAADAGTPAVRVAPVPLCSDDVLDALTAVDEAVLSAAVSGHPPSAGALQHALRVAIAARALTPLVCGSAVTGAGTDGLREVLTQLLPRAAQLRDGPPAASVFAVDRDERGRRAWLRIWRGELRVRGSYAPAGRHPERVTGLAISRAGGLGDVAVAGPGAVVAARGPHGWRVGDVLGEPPARRRHRFAPATLHAGVEPCDPRQREQLFAALRELADEDPLIDVRRDEDGCSLSLHGEVQQQVIAALLDERFGVRVRFRGTRIVCIERVTGRGSAREEIGVAANPYLAGIGLRIEPAPGPGVHFSPGVERGHLPPAFVAATEDGVRAALRQGRFGWAVTDCRVSMTGSQYQPRQSHAHQKFNKAMSSVGADFRHLAQVVVTAALEQAGTRVCEPVDRYELEFPEALVNPVSAVLARLGALVLDSRTAGGWARFTGHLRSAVVPDLAARLPDLSGGEAVLQTGFDHYAPVSGRPPRRPHTGPDPRDRAEWFRAMPRSRREAAVASGP